MSRKEEQILDQYKKKNILVVGKKDYDLCVHEGVGAELQQDNVAILKLPIQRENKDSRFLSSLDNEGLLISGNILVQSPFDTDTYVDAASALQQFSLDKHMYFSQLCQLLGAKKLTVNEINIKNVNGKSSFNLSSKVSLVDGKVSVEYEELEHLKSSLELKDAFEGSDPDVEAAKEFLFNHRLNLDPQMKALVQMRGNNNPLKSRTLKINLSREAKKSLSVVAHLKIPDLFKMDTSFNKQVDENTEYELQVTIAF
jgi:hypothetical protein